MEGNFEIIGSNIFTAIYDLINNKFDGVIFNNDKKDKKKDFFNNNNNNNKCSKDASASGVYSRLCTYAKKKGYPMKDDNEIKANRKKGNF